MLRLRPAARLLLLATFVAGWAGSALGVPGLLLLSADGHGHELELVVDNGHRDAVLRHAEHTPHDAPHAGEPHANAPHGDHSDHTIHLPDVDPAVTVRSLPAHTFVAVVALAWTVAPRADVAHASRPPLPDPVPDGPRAALRSTVLLV